MKPTVIFLSLSLCACAGIAQTPIKLSTAKQAESKPASPKPAGPCYIVAGGEDRIQVPCQ